MQVDIRFVEGVAALAMCLAGIVRGWSWFLWLGMGERKSSSAIAIANSTLTGSVRKPACVDFIEWMPMSAMRLFSQIVGIATNTVAMASALCGCVAHIGELIANEEMSRITTRRIVAAMAYIKTFGDSPKSQYPRKTMRNNSPLAPVASAPNPNLSVAVGIAVAQPRPTGVRITPNYV